MTIKLTPAQERIIPYIIDGWSYASIAKEIGIGIRTVKMHVYGIAAKVPPSPHTPTYRRVQLWAMAHGIGTQEPLL